MVRQDDLFNCSDMNDMNRGRQRHQVGMTFMVLQMYATDMGEDIYGSSAMQDISSDMNDRNMGRQGQVFRSGRHAFRNGLWFFRSAGQLFR